MLHLQSPVYISLKVPSPEPSLHISRSPQKRNTPSRFPLRSPYIEQDASSPEPSLHNSQSPQKRNPPPGSPYGAPTYRKMFHLQSPLYIYSKFPEKKPPSRFPCQSPAETDAPFPEPSSACLSQSLVKEHPPPSRFPIRAPMERAAHQRAYYTYLSKFPIKEPSSKFPLRPYGERCPSPGPSTLSFIKPSKGSPLPGSPLRAPRGMLHFQNTLLLVSERPGKRAPYLVPQRGPHGERCPSLEPSYMNSLICGERTWSTKQSPHAR
jgi:hypothetical protein